LIPLRFNKTAPADATATAVPMSVDGKAQLEASAGSLLRRLIKAKPAQYPPPKPFEMPKYSKYVVIPPILDVLKNEAIGKAKQTKQAIGNKINDLENEIGLKYRDFNDKLINEAANRYISKRT
jgi:hypothetical protein